MENMAKVNKRRREITILKHKKLLEPFTEWEEYDNMCKAALMHITSALSSGLVVKFLFTKCGEDKTFETPKELWDEIKNHFQRSSQLSKSQLETKLCNLKLEKDDTVDSYAEKIEFICSQLSRVKVKVEEYRKREIWLAGLGARN